MVKWSGPSLLGLSKRIMTGLTEGFEVTRKCVQEGSEDILLKMNDFSIKNEMSCYLPWVTIKQLCFVSCQSRRLWSVVCGGSSIVKHKTRILE
jgi:hypothetical protein